MHCEKLMFFTVHFDITKIRLSHVFFVCSDHLLDHLTAY